MTPATLVERLRRLDTCAISDALDKLDLPPAVSGISARTMRARIAGRIVTVKQVEPWPGPGRCVISERRLSRSPSAAR